MRFPSPEETVRLMFELRLPSEADGRRTEVLAHRIEAHGDEVLAYGRLRVVDGGSLTDSPAQWRCTVRDGRVLSVTPELP